MSRFIVCAYFLLFGGSWPVSVQAATPPVDNFTPGNILLTRNSIFSSGTDFLYEYTVGGALVQTIPIGRPEGAQLTAGDAVYDSQGRIHLVHDDSYISTFDPATQLWRHTPAPVAISNGSDYDLSIYGEYVFQRQMRMNINTFEVTAINPGSPGTYSETSIGQDGLLYSILNFGSPRWDVQRTDPNTLQPVGPIMRLRDSSGGTLDGRGIAATRKGEMFIADWNGTIYKYDRNGVFLSELFTGADDLLGINLRSDGLIMASSRFGDVIFTDVNFSTLSMFNVGNSNSLNENVFASFVSLPIPEPSALWLFCIGTISFCCQRARPSRRAFSCAARCSSSRSV